MSMAQTVREFRQWRRAENFSTIPPMLLRDIPERLKLMRSRQADLARHLSLDPSSLTKTIKGSRRVTPVELAKMETFFGERLEVSNQAPISARRRMAPAKVPVYGYAAGGEDRIAYADDRIIDYLDAPPFWNGTGELIYVRLPGDSMEPRYFSGEILPVRMNLPPAKGQDCLLLFNDSTALVKTYQGQRDGKVFARQYNIEKELMFEGASVQSMHAIWRPGML